MEPRTGLVVVAGLAADAVTRVADGLLTATPGTVVVHHDLRELSQGVVRRRVRAAEGEQVTAVELAHGCLSCTLREDLLPLLVRLADRPAIRRIVLHLDPALEPESICWALHHVLLTGEITVADRVDIEAVLTVVDLATWLADATGDEDLAERGLAITPDDDRTLAQVAVGQVEFADALVLSGIPGHAWGAARTTAVLDRLAPAAPGARIEDIDPTALLAALPGDARRGRVEDPHGPILRGQPPLDADCGIALTLFSERRPFHPERLHAAIDVLLDGVVRARGRFWVASQPDSALWLESSGGGLRIGHVGPWLAALDESTWDDESAERRAMAALSWDAYYGDRAQDLVILSHQADPNEITTALNAALLTDAELAEGAQRWRELPDPFGDWHVEPCEDRASSDQDTESTTRGERQ
ncbi:MAG TPA: GTP-binding protein [Pseudonocardiaceae bacterium]